MAGMDSSQQYRQGADALGFDDGGPTPPGCQAGDLKSLLNAIVEQITEADRRHSDTLQQLQERLSGIGREAKAIKPRVPDQYAAAFERIEAGMAELASRITDAGAGVPAYSHHDTDPVYEEPANRAPLAAHGTPTMTSTSAMFASHPNFAEPPAALRSASDVSSQVTHRMHAGVDTFDVIESSMPPNVSDPWDRDAAEALTGLYESGAVGFKSKSFAPSPSMPQADAMGSAAPAVLAGVDHVWLEARFADVSKRIEESLNELRPDQGFFSLGQRVDQLEQHFSNLMEDVATRGDVEGVRLIEAHVSELAGHLENAHNQLMRLDVIEDHLAGIASKLDDVHRAAAAATDSDVAPVVMQPEIDMDAFARTAAEAAAQQFAKMQPPASAAASADTSEISDMLRMFIAESRQGEENTSVLLDTLQQAIIRLLDRVDAMEMSTLQSVQAQVQAIAQAHAQATPNDFGRAQNRFASDAGARPNPGHSEPGDPLDAAVAAVATARSSAPSYGPSSGSDYGASARAARPDQAAEQAAQRSPEKMRQDFIAEARRAKMRLAAESDAEGGVTLSRPDAPLAVEPTKSSTQAARGAAKTTVAAPEKKAASSGGAPRIKVLALSAILALGGVWLAKESGMFSGEPVVATVPLQETAPGTAATATPADPSAASGTAASDPAAPAKEGGVGDLKLPEGTRGEIVADDIVVGSTTVPLYGVTVDSERQMTAADLTRARREQAMAAVSSQLGEAAQRNASALAIPAAIDPNAGDGANADVNGGQTSVTKSGMSQSAALDLPPATVGPLSLRLAAANGDPSAEFEVGARLAEGKGTEQTFKDAAKWYQRSASQGLAQAQYRLGTLYERGLGLKADPQRAQEWYTRAAEQGNIKAMHNLAVLSANQSKGAPDYTTAAIWFEKAAEHGLSDSQFNLAVLNENGLGVEQNMVAAYKWLSLAAKSGDKEAIRRRDILKGKLTAEQLAKADGLVATWRAKPQIPDVNDARKAGEAWKKNPENGING